MLHNPSKTVLRKFNVCLCVCNLNIGTKKSKASKMYIFHWTPVKQWMYACRVVCLDWGWGISLGPCCGWTCLSPLFWSETLIISLVWTVITPSLFWTSPPPPASQGKRSCGPAWSRTPKSILEKEAEGGVTHKYVPRSVCLHYGPWYSLCPSLTGIMLKSNIQSYLFKTQMHDTVKPLID